MCGIAGFFDLKKQLSSDHMHDIAHKMAQTIKHRGPDDQGIWTNAENGIAFAQRRLAIIDLSPLGHQPYLSDDGKHILNFNGEIYNYLDIKEELTTLGYSFKSHSDTEVLLKAILHWGIDQTLPKLNGMFAFAYCNLQQQKTYLVRDRLGVKPLYWFLDSNFLGFASELKALKPLPSFQKQIHFDALYNYFRFGFIPAPLSIYENTRKLEPGHYLNIDMSSYKIHNHKYWHIPNIPIAKDKNDILEELHVLLQDAVKIRMIADVPLGALLSGGIDSSLITALMQKQSNTPIKTFSIGFRSSDHNEAPFAENIAAYLGTDHQSLYIDAQDGLKLVPQLSRHYDEPFGDSSAIPTLLLSKLTRQFVKVALTGDGGDEVFLGYNRYPILERFRKFWHWSPGIKKAFLKPLAFFSPDTYDNVLKIFPQQMRPKMIGDKIHKFSTSLIQENYDDLYAYLFGQWADTNALMSQGKALALKSDASKNCIDAIQECDIKYYLPDDILTKVDRASMAFGLEARNPLLDFRIVSYAASMPRDMLLNDYTTKWALRQLVKKYIPKKLYERPKSGFAIPLKNWLRLDLKSWAEDLLFSKEFRQLDYLNHNLVQEKWVGFLKGRSESMHQLWTILMFAQWAQNEKNNE